MNGGNGLFCSGLAVLFTWMLWLIASSLATSTVVPAGNASTCGTYSQAFWSKTGFAVAGAIALPFVALTTTTALAMPPSAPTSSSGDCFSLPQTSLSLVTVMAAGFGAVPGNLTVPDSVPPSVTVVASYAPAGAASATAAASTRPLVNVVLRISLLLVM